MTAPSYRRFMLSLLVTGLFLPLAFAWQKNTQGKTVPTQVRFSGAVKDLAGATRQGTVALMFTIYREQTGGAPLWQETQNVQLDSQGRYNALLGSGRQLPIDIFSSNEARWLGVQVLEEGEAEQPRVLLVSVPYALKARDAETLGGRPASAYVLHDNLVGPTDNRRIASGQAAGKVLDSGTVSTTVAHTVNAIPKFSATDTLADSLMFEQYTQPALDAFGGPLGFNEDVVKVGNGTGLAKMLEVTGRLVSDGLDINTSLASSVHIVNTNSGGVALQTNALAQGADFTNGIFASAQSASAVGVQGSIFEPSSPSVPGSDYTYSILGTNTNPEGATLFGWHRYNGAGGDGLPSLTGPVGVFASVAHSSGTAAIFDNRSGSGKILSARSSGTEVVGVTTAGNITASGSVTAASFSGSGAGLTGVTASSATTAGALSSDPAACAANNFVTDIAANGTLTCNQPSSANLSDGASLATVTYVDAADSNLAAPQYVTLASNATLANERTLTAGHSISITDAGAGSTVTLAGKNEFAQTSIQAGDTLTGAAQGPGNFATTYTIPANTLAVGMVIEIWAAGSQTTDGVAPNGNAFGYGVRFGSTDLLTTAIGNFQNQNLTRGWNLQARLICTSVAGANAMLEAQGLMTSGTTSTAFATLALSNTATITVDPTQTQTVTIRETIALNGTDSATLRQLIVKILK